MSALYPSSQRYMLPIELKPLVLSLFEQARSAAGANLGDGALFEYLDGRADRPLPESSVAACAVGQLRGIALAACSRVLDLLQWAQTPDVAKSIMDANVHYGSRLADLRDPLARQGYERVISRQFARESEVKVCKPHVEVSCAGCEDAQVIIHEDGTCQCLTLGTACLFEWLPVTDLKHRVPLCSDCAAEAFAIQSVGFAPLHLEQFQEALDMAKQARELEPDNNELYEDGASIQHYEAAMRRRDRLKQQVGGQP